MSEQTATSELVAATRALELQPPRSTTRRLRRSERGRLAARLSVDAGSLFCAAIVVLASEQASMRAWALVLAGLAILAGYALAGLYAPRSRSRLSTELGQVLSVAALVTMGVAATELAGGRQDVGDAAVRFWLVASTLTAGGRLALYGAYALRRRAASADGAATLIVGAGRVGHLAAERLLNDPALDLRPIGFLDKDPLGAGDRPDLPVLGASYDLERVVREYEVEHVLVAFSTAPSHVVLSLVRRCWALGVSVMVVPRLYEVEGRRARIEHLGALPVVSLSAADPRGWQFAVKYFLDRFVAGVALLLLSPLLGALALAILVTSGRPILFRQRRVGRDGHVFEMLKFRTMSGSPDVDGELDAEWAAIATGAAAPPPAASDPEDRRTPLGAWLRRFSLDELPQLWNVVRGDMSIIGPRPERVDYVELFEHAIYRYPDRHRVKSGLTGWAQVNGLRGESSLPDRIEWDNFYIENWSPWLDLKVLVKTVPALLGRRGAH